MRATTSHGGANRNFVAGGAQRLEQSTLTELPQRLYAPQSRWVLVDGQDIATADATQLRRQVGVVLHENALFNCSVPENIAIAIDDPGAPLEAVIHAAKLVGGEAAEHGADGAAAASARSRRRTWRWHCPASVSAGAGRS